jgi:hypothetical protein
MSALRNEEDPPLPAGPRVTHCSFRYSAATAYGSVATGSSSVGELDSAMAVSPPMAANSSPLDSTGELDSASRLDDAAVTTRPSVRSGSGSQPDPASSSCALSAISPFLR